MIGIVRWGLAAVAALGVSFGLDQPAQACGGFFCDTNGPVNQAAERIIFAKNPNDTVTAVIQILYEGPAEGFSWVLPVPGVPEVQVSSDLAFQRLQNATNPQYQLETRIEGTCASTDDAWFGPPSAGSVSDAGLVADESDRGSGVHVLDRGNVGPYDYVVISLDPGHEHPGDAAVDWLQDNGYDVDDFGRDRLGPYLADGLNLIAFRLTKSRSAGSIRPIRLTYPQGAPVIPIRPTAVAANEDMGVLVWVLGESRAVPINYLALELNEALIDWFFASRNYDDVVSAAADEAGGHGFVTEMSQSASVLADVVMGSGDRNTWSSTLARSDWDDAHGELLWVTGINFGAWDGYLDVFARHVPVPEGVDEDQFLACPDCFLDFSQTEIEGFHPEAYLADLAEEVIEPMEATQALLDGAPHMTRLYTTLSPHEMTVDPLFDFNPDLEDVSNVHTATRIIECSATVTQWEAPWRVELASGHVVRGQGNTWPLSLESGLMPLNQRILDMTTRGDGHLVTDNAGAIEAALAEHNATVPGPPTASGGGCAVGGFAGPGVVGAAAGLLLLLLVVRRRGRA
jgi:hypothetical protein